MYSQNNEERFILSILKNRTGKLLDIGANDGRTFSNSLALIERGWSADLVEPNKDAFRLLKELHKGNDNVICWNCAVSDYEGTAELLYSSDARNPKDVGLVSTLYEHETKRWRKHAFTPVLVDVLHAKTFSHAYDFITIDCEGSEEKIIPHLDYSNCLCICIEWNGNTRLRDLYSNQFKGFRIVHTTGENLIYEKDNSYVW